MSSKYSETYAIKESSLVGEGREEGADLLRMKFTLGTGTFWWDGKGD